jgi:hypothetical protein
MLSERIVFGVIVKPFEIFICHKKSSGKDFADHLKAGLEELGYHAFLDSKDIPKMTDGKEEWIDIRNQALRESNTFILIITPGFDLSQEVKNELKLARATGNKKFLYFRHRDLGRKIIVDLENEKVDLGRQEQVSFESKEELLRLAHGILCKEAGISPQKSPLFKNEKNQMSKPSNASLLLVTANVEEPKKDRDSKVPLCCEMCLKPIDGQPYIDVINEKSHNFDCKECAQTFKRFKSVYGDEFK